MSEQITLKGITWNHSRGYTPLVATAQRWLDAHPEVTISWEKRSLKDFGDFPIQRLVDQFDLLIIDHPFAGYASAHPVLTPLDAHLSANYLAEQAANSVGASWESYWFGGHLWALPIDAATPIAGWRQDLLDRHDAAVPATWEELIALARRGLVAVSGAAVDCQMHLYMLALGLGAELFTSDEVIGPEAELIGALELLRDLLQAAGPVNLTRNPIRTWEAIATGDDVAYCPFAYGYSNYGRREFTDKPLSFGGLVSLSGRRLRSVLGGTGLAISHRTTGPALAAAIAYASWICGSDCQRSFYTTHSGQPGHRAAWVDDGLNLLTNGFFRDTLQTLDEAYLRPRYNGYIPFQDHGGDVVHGWLRDGGEATAVVAELNRLYRESKQHGD